MTHKQHPRSILGDEFITLSNADQTEQQLLDAFQNTNVVSILHWNILSQNCCLLWHGIYCDEDGNIEQVYLHHLNLTGSINWSSLPNTIKKLWLNDNHLNGTINLYQLPHSLISIDLANNEFYGNIDLTHIPSSTHLQELYLNDNLLTGSIDLSHLPQTL